MLREACGVSFGLPASQWMLEIGAVFMRTETELILKSRRVVPARLLEHGFRFEFPDWRDAAARSLSSVDGRSRQGTRRHLGRRPTAETAWRLRSIQLVSNAENQPMPRPIVRARCLSALVVLVAASSIAAPGASEQSGQLRLVSTLWPPFTAPAGQPRFALDLVEAGLGRIGMSGSTTFVEAAQFTPALFGSDFDGSGAAWKDAERDRVLLFSEPYLENRLVLVGRAGRRRVGRDARRAQGPPHRHCRGLRVRPCHRRGRTDIARTSGEEDSVRQLLAKTVDFALIDELVVNYIVEHHPEEAKKRLQLGAIPLVTRQLFFTVNRARADAHAIVKRFNAQLRGMIADRTYHRLLHVEWISADVNGDGTPSTCRRATRWARMEPKGAYVVLSTPPQAKPAAPTNAPGFYVGGNLYRDWASVPQSYKDIDPTWRNPRRASGTVFRFTW